MIVQSSLLCLFYYQRYNHADMEDIGHSLGIPYQWSNLRIGERYIRVDQMLFPSPPTVDVFTFPPNKQVIKVLDKQMARVVLEHDFSYVSKSGYGIRTSEAEAMKLVFQHTSVPVTKVLVTRFDGDDGNIRMTMVPGTCLQAKWDKLGVETKKSVCLQI